MWKKIKPKLFSQLYQLPGWHTNKKIVVIESDDWGAYRMRNRQTRDELENIYARKFQNPYDRLDCLEQNEDLIQLLNVLTSFNSKPHPPVITLNIIIANPDFQKIKYSGFHQYYYKTIKECYIENYRSDRVLNYIQDGTALNFIKPQFHGREHLQVLPWLKDLQNNQTEIRAAFDRGVYSISSEELSSSRGNYMAAYDHHSPKELAFIQLSIKEGLNLFHKTFGYRSISAIAPAAVWNNAIEQTYKKGGVGILQGFVIQYITDPRKNLKKKYRYTGELNSNHQIYLTRNCYFEPSTNANIDWVDKCLNQIRRAFLVKKPAIISSHRINFVGGIEEKNRIESLTKFNHLLTKIYQNWPEVLFLSSDQLGTLVRNDVVSASETT